MRTKSKLTLTHLITEKRNIEEIQILKITIKILQSSGKTVLLNWRKLTWVLLLLSYNSAGSRFHWVFLCANFSRNSLFLDRWLGLGEKSAFFKIKKWKTIKVIMKLKLNYSSKIVICGNQKIIINFT